MLQKLTQIVDMCDSRGLDVQKEICKEFESTTVITRYNNKSYRISRVEFDMSPTSKFTDSTGQLVTFVDYYKKKYNEEVTTLN